MINVVKRNIKKILVFIFAFILNLFGKFLSSKNKYIVCFDCLYDENQEQNDVFTFFEYLKDNQIPVKYFILKDAKLKSDKYIDDVIFVKNKWEFIFKHLRLIASSKYILTSFGLFDGIDEVLKEYNKTTYIFAQHGVSYCSSWLSEIYSSKKFDKILVPTQFTYDLYKKNDLWQENQMILSGLPRWDNLLGLYENEIFVFFTWKKSIILSEKYAKDFVQNVADFMEKLSCKISKDVKISFAWHHEFYRRKVELPKFNSRINLINSCDIFNTINRASLLITDYSSIFWDFLYQNKPVIFYRFNQDDLLKDDKKIANEIISLDDKFFNCFYNLNDALKKAAFYCLNKYQLEQNYFNKINNYFFEKGCYCEKICKKLKDLS